MRPAIFLLLAGGFITAQAQEGAWIAQEELTPSRLSTSGAVLTGTDALDWPDGRSANVTYWLGVDDIVFRCAELRDGEGSTTSCWRLQPIVPEAAPAASQTVRVISTRRRPPVHLYRHPYSYYGGGLHPRIWIGGFR